MDICKHVNEMSDQHTGDYICIDCGFVKGVFYQEKFTSNIDSDNLNTSDLLNNLIEKFNIPERYSTVLHKNLENSENVKNLMCRIYEDVNKEGNIVLLKSIINLTGLKVKEIKSSNIHAVNVETILEKYFAMFRIPYKQITIFKNFSKQFTNTGYQPLSIVGGLIYVYYIRQNKKVSMREIAQQLGINAISIQRFVKKNHVLFKQL